MLSGLVAASPAALRPRAKNGQGVVVKRGSEVKEQMWGAARAPALVAKAMRKLQPRAWVKWWLHLAKSEQIYYYTSLYINKNLLESQISESRVELMAK